MNDKGETMNETPPQYFEIFFRKILRGRIFC